MAGPLAGMLLAEQGAEVIRVVDTAREPGDPVLDALLARGKTEICVDLRTPAGQELLRDLVSLADVVVENVEPGTVGLDRDAIRAQGNPGLVWCSIPTFPAGDPRADLPDHESVVGTAAYLYEKPLGMPQVHPFPLASVLGALFSASATVAALIARLRTGRGQDVTTSLYHAGIFSQVVLILMRTGVPRGFLPLKMVGTPFMGSWLCGDGRYIYLHISLPAHNKRILEVLEREGYVDDVRALRGILSAETMRDPSQVKSIPEAKAIREVYQRIFATRSAEAWEKTLGGELCCIKVRTVDEWLPTSTAAGMEDSCTVKDPVMGELVCPGAAVTLAEHPPVLGPRRTNADPSAVVARWKAEPRLSLAPCKGWALEPALAHPLQGIRVVDISRVIAGPCAARILAELGAEVLSVQKASSLDWALSFHLLFNAGKRSVSLDFSDDQGKRDLWTLLDAFQPHAFIQNYRHMDLAREIGVGPEHLRARFPHITYTHLNAYGNVGSYRDSPGFEQVVQAISGIQMTYGGGKKPKLLPAPVIDIGSGLLGALGTLLGLYQQVRAGQSVVASTHLTRTAVLFQVEPVAAYQRARCREAARQSGAAWTERREVVSRILRARDGFFCVTGPRADVATWLEHAGLGRPSGNGNPLEHASRRVALRSTSHWRRTVSQAGLEGSVVLLPVPRMARLLDEVPRPADGGVPLVRRRAYPGVTSPLTFIANPMHLSLTPTVDVSPAPSRGLHTRQVLEPLGARIPPGDGQVPYPAAKPLHVWIATLVRWGYFAWRSGNI
jgi:crotonobetainyl-CoA:carnitine CoA-transferase CaiB-like acyl-CoA transferase